MLRQVLKDRFGNHEVQTSRLSKMRTAILFFTSFYKTMSLQTPYEFLFVGRDEGTFVENYAYDLGEGGEQSGKIFINLEIRNNLADAETIGEVIFDTMRKAFFADLEGEPYHRFEDALKHVNKALNEFKVERKSQYLGELHVLIAAIVGNNLYLSQCGEAEAYLIRRRFSTTVSEGLFDPESKDLFTNIASGTLETDDFVLLSSTQLLRYVPKAELGKMASAHNLVASLAELKDYLAHEILGRVGFIGIGVYPAVPQFSGKEKERVVAHLQKEERYQEGQIDQRKLVNVVVTDFGKQLLNIANNFQKRLQTLRKAQSSKEIMDGARIGSRSTSGKFLIGNWSKDKVFGVLIIVILFLTISVWWLRGKAEEQQKMDNYSAILNQVQTAISSAETSGSFDKEKATQLLNDAEKNAFDVLNSGYNRSKATELLTLIKDERNKLDGVTPIQPKILADLSLKRTTVNALGLLFQAGKLFAYEYNALYPLLLDKVQDPVPLGENETVIGGTAFDDKDSLIFFTKEGRMLEYLNDHVTALTSTDSAFHKGFAVQAYGNKVYVLDPASNKIWKYARRRDNFDAAVAYNVDGDVSKGISFAIDGNVFVLNSDGSISWFYSGTTQKFSVKKAPMKALTVPTKIYTELDMPELYVLEPSAHRIVVFYKDDKGANDRSLVYSMQYVFDGLDDVRDFYVDKGNKKIYLLDHSKVYQFSM